MRHPLQQQQKQQPSAESPHQQRPLLGSNHVVASAGEEVGGGLAGAVSASAASPLYSHHHHHQQQQQLYNNHHQQQQQQQQQQPAVATAAAPIDNVSYYSEDKLWNVTVGAGATASSSSSTGVRQRSYGTLLSSSSTATATSQATPPSSSLPLSQTATTTNASTGIEAAASPHLPHHHSLTMDPMYIDNDKRTTAESLGLGGGEVNHRVPGADTNDLGGVDGEEMDDVDTLSSPASSYDGHEKLGVASLAVMVFYSVSGGPFGIEPSVRSAGNMYTLLGFMIMPFCWSLQEALVTAELGAAFPDASGGVAWCHEAFGPAAGWMAGYFAWVSGATDNAIYPVLFLDYLLQVTFPPSTGEEGEQDEGDDDKSMNPILRFILLSATSISLAYVNWLGLPVVGKMSIAICTLAMSPFIILVIVGVWQVDPALWFRPPTDTLEQVEEIMDDDIGGGFFPSLTVGGVLWRPFLNNLFWNLNSFDNAGNFSADAQNPGHVFPRAMMCSVALVAAGYFIPLLVALGASPNVAQHDWVNGYLARVASDVVGPWLGAWTVFAAGISNVAMFQAELSSDAFQLMGMADRGHVPKLFSHRSRHGTPTYAIMLGTFVIVVMGVSNLDTLIEMLNFNYALSVLMEYCAFLHLRVYRPDLERPWRVPLSTTGCFLALIPTFSMTLLVMSLATFTTYAFSLGTIVVGIALYYIFQRGDDLVNDSKILCSSLCLRERVPVITTMATMATMPTTTVAEQAGMGVGGRNNGGDYSYIQGGGNGVLGDPSSPPTTADDVTTTVVAPSSYMGQNDLHLT